MTLQVKLENIFKNLVETEQKFGPNNKFIGLKVNNLDGSESNDDDLGKVYLGDLKLYNLLGNKFKSVDLFIKIESKDLKQSKDIGQITYDYKFNNEFVAYKHILPVLNQAFTGVNKGRGSLAIKHLTSNEENDSAYTMAEFKNDTRYREIGNVNKMKHRHSWNPSDEDKLNKEKFYTIRPNNNKALEKCDKYRRREGSNDQILKLFPKFYHGEVNDDEDQDNIVVIENMLPAGFHTSDDGIFLDKERVLVTLKALGKFHASSYIAKHDNLEEFTKAVKKLKPTGWTVPEYWDIYPNFLDEHLLRGIKYLINDPDYEKQVSKFENIVRSPKDFFFDILETDEKTAVVCHGDFCKNNILYKYDTSPRVISNSDNGPTDGMTKSANITTEKWGSREEIQENFHKDIVRTKSASQMVETIRTEAAVEQNIIGQENLPQGKHENNRTKLIISVPKDVDIEMDEIKKENKGTKEKEDFQNETGSSEMYARLVDEEHKRYYSTAISNKRKEFLNLILGSNNAPIHAGTVDHMSKDIIKPKECYNTYSHGEEKSEEEDFSGSKKSNALVVSLNEEILKNKNEIIHFNSENFKSSYRKICCGRPVLKHSVSLFDPYTQREKEDSLKRSISVSDQMPNYSSRDENEVHSKFKEKSENEENHAINDRLNYLEGKYKELERIYRVNQCVLERRRVNNKIIEKLNEKKEILEEICKRIENINTKQEMESKIQRGITKLYQNLDDLQIKRNSNTSPRKPNHNNNNLEPSNSSTIETKKDQIVQIHKSEGKAKQQNLQKDKTTENHELKLKIQNLVRNQNFKAHKETNGTKKFEKKGSQKTDQIGNIDEEFDSIYEELFSSENVAEYETLFTELTKKEKEFRKNEDSSTVHNDMIYISEKKTVERKFHDQVVTHLQESEEQDKGEYYTLSVKQRRDNLERTISLETVQKAHAKIMKRSNTEANVVKLNKPLISERNITLYDHSNEDFEKETLRKELLRSAFNKSNARARFFTDSSLSINEDKETDDEVFEEENKSLKVKISAHLEPHQRMNDEMTRSQSLADLKKKTRPVPMKRTISLAHEIKTKQNSSETSNKSTISNNNSLYTGVSEPVVKKEQIPLLGVTDGDDKRDYLTKHKAFSLPKTVLTSPFEFSKDLTALKKQSSNSSTLPRISKPSFTTVEKPKENDSTDFVFFDLARMIYASPVIDLSFFLFLNVSHQLRNDCWDEFISAYHSSLVENAPHIPIPSLEEIHLELKRKAVYGYFLCCFFLPWMMEENPHEEVEEWIHHGGEAGTKAVADILKFLIDRDYV